MISDRIVAATPLPTSHGHGHDRGLPSRAGGTRSLGCSRAQPYTPSLVAAVEAHLGDQHVPLTSLARGEDKGTPTTFAERGALFFSRHMLLNQGSRVARFQKKKRDAVFRPRCRGVGRLLWSSEGCLVSVVSMCLEVAVSHRLTLTASIAILPVSELPQCCLSEGK